MIVVNSNTRQFNIPGADMTFGVEADAGSERKYFQCPRYVGNNLDLAGSFIRINYRNANGDVDSYLVNDVTVEGDNITFSWELTPKVTAYKGQIRFVMCVIGPDTKVAWHTTLGTGVVLEGLEPDYVAIQAGTVDVIAQLIALVEEQTAAVTAEGTRQVAVVKAAAKTAQDYAVAQVEAKGASTLATIPGDYTATVSAVQSAANAIRKKVSGEVIRVDDVSPMEHYPEIKVHGKNLFFSNKDFTGTLNDVTYSIQENTSELTFNGTATQENAFALPDSFVLPKGTYTASITGLNMSGPNGNDRMYLRNQTQGEVLVNHITPANPKTFTLTEDALIRTYIVFKAQSAYDNVKLSIQIEKGDTATEYTPYIDPTTVAVSRCGKNLFTLDDIGLNQSSGKGEIENGVLTVTGYLLSYRVPADGLVGQKCILSCKSTRLGEKGGGVSVEFRGPENEKMSGVYQQNVLSPTVSFTVPEGTADIVFFFYASGSNTESGTATYRDVQLEIGSIASVYEQYNGETQIPTANGTVSGLTAVSPTMTLLTDTAGVTIDCEYSRDTNVVIAEILEKITALGG